MIETNTTTIIRCDLCLKELDGARKETKKYLPLSIRMLESMFGSRYNPDLCKNCFKKYREHYKLKL